MSSNGYMDARKRGPLVISHKCRLIRWLIFLMPHQDWSCLVAKSILLASNN